MCAKPIDPELMALISSTAYALGHTTTDLGVWFGGFHEGVHLALDYAARGNPIPSREDLTLKANRALEADGASALVAICVYQTLFDRYDEWRREAESYQVDHPKEFDAYERTLTEARRAWEKLKTEGEDKP